MQSQANERRKIIPGSEEVGNSITSTLKSDKEVKQWIERFLKGDEPTKHTMIKNLIYMNYVNDRFNPRYTLEYQSLQKDIEHIEQAKRSGAEQNLLDALIKKAILDYCSGRTTSSDYLDQFVFALPEQFNILFSLMSNSLQQQVVKLLDHWAIYNLNSDVVSPWIASPTLKVDDVFKTDALEELRIDGYYAATTAAAAGAAAAPADDYYDTATQDQASSQAQSEPQYPPFPPAPEQTTQKQEQPAPEEDDFNIFAQIAPQYPSSAPGQVQMGTQGSQYTPPPVAAAAMTPAAAAAGSPEEDIFGISEDRMPDGIQKFGGPNNATVIGIYTKRELCDLFNAGKVDELRHIMLNQPFLKFAPAASLYIRHYAETYGQDIHIDLETSKNFINLINLLTELDRQNSSHSSPAISLRDKMWVNLLYPDFLVAYPNRLPPITATQQEIADNRRNLDAAQRDHSVKFKLALTFISPGFNRNSRDQVYNAPTARQYASKYGLLAFIELYNLVVGLLSPIEQQSTVRTLLIQLATPMVPKGLTLITQQVADLAKFSEGNLSNFAARLHEEFFPKSPQNPYKVAQYITQYGAREWRKLLELLHFINPGYDRREESRRIPTGSILSYKLWSGLFYQNQSAPQPPQQLSQQFRNDISQILRQHPANTQPRNTSIIVKIETLMALPNDYDRYQKFQYDGYSEGAYEFAKRYGINEFIVLYNMFTQQFQDALVLGMARYSLSLAPQATMQSNAPSPKSFSSSSRPSMPSAWPPMPPMRPPMPPASQSMAAPLPASYRTTTSIAPPHLSASSTMPRPPAAAPKDFFKDVRMEYNQLFYNYKSSQLKGVSYPAMKFDEDEVVTDNPLFQQAAENVLKSKPFTDQEIIESLSNTISAKARISNLRFLITLKALADHNKIKAAKYLAELKIVDLIEFINQNKHSEHYKTLMTALITVLSKFDVQTKNLLLKNFFDHHPPSGDAKQSPKKQQVALNERINILCDLLYQFETLYGPNGALGKLNILLETITSQLSINQDNTSGTHILDLEKQVGKYYNYDARNLNSYLKTHRATPAGLEDAGLATHDTESSSEDETVDTESSSEDETVELNNDPGMLRRIIDEALAKDKRQGSVNNHRSKFYRVLLAIDQQQGPNDSTWLENYFTTFTLASPKPSSASTRQNWFSRMFAKKSSATMSATPTDFTEDPGDRLEKIYIIKNLIRAARTEGPRAPNLTEILNILMRQLQVQNGHRATISIAELEQDAMRALGIDDERDKRDWLARARAARNPEATQSMSSDDYMF